ncbi:MAG: hypothetical protein FWE05_03460 [Defluviitaleaceae bacterium]|nr:hypothetical protein [Defluviitaleaceae bacterium]
MQTLKKILKCAGIVMGTFVLLVLIFHLIPRRPTMEANPFIVGRGNRPMVAAHAGGNLEFPGNTLEAMFNSYHVDPNVMFELDVNMTRDGVIILSHCRTLDRRSNVTGYIHDWYFADLVEQEVSFGYFHPIGSNGTRPLEMDLIPYTNYAGVSVTPLDVVYPLGVSPRHDYKFLVTTLEEAIRTFPNNLMTVEVKQSGDIGLQSVDAIIELMERLDAAYNTFARIGLASFHTSNFERFVELRETTHPQLMFSPSGSGLRPVYIAHWVGLDFIYNPQFTLAQIPTREGSLPLDTRHFIRALHRHNIAVQYWTINDEETMRHLISQGADAIVTGRPTLLKEILDEIFEQY